MQKIAVILMVGFVVMSLLWSSPIVAAQEPDEQEEPDPDGDSGTTYTPDEPSGSGPPENTAEGQEESSPFEIPIVVPVVIIAVVVLGVIIALARRRKSEEFVPVLEEAGPPPV